MKKTVLLSCTQMADLLGTSRRKLRRLAERGEIPPPIVAHNGRAVGWPSNRVRVIREAILRSEKKSEKAA